MRSTFLSSKIELDLLLTNLLSILLILIVVFLPSNILRAVLGFPFVTFFPGYVFTKIYFSEEEINLLERVALSFGISMIIVPVLGLNLAYSPLKITLYPSLFSIYIFILITSIIGQYRPKFSFSIKGGINPLISLKSINVVLAFILITLLGIFIRFYPALDYSLFGGNWMPGNHLYPIYYTLQTGELLERDIINTPTLFSCTIYNVLHNKANTLFQIFTFLILGFPTLNEFLWLNKFFPWYGALLFPLSALLVANRIGKNQGKNIPTCYNLFIYFVATFASYILLIASSFITNNAIIGLLFIFYSIYFLIGNKNPKNQLFGILFGIFIFLSSCDGIIPTVETSFEYSSWNE